MMSRLGADTAGHSIRNFNPDTAADLRRRRQRDMVEAVVARAAWLPDAERALLEAVYRDGRSARALAGLLGENPRLVRARVRRAVKRVLDPRFAFVVRNRGRWTTSRRRVATECLLNGRSIRGAADSLGLSLHTVRLHRAAVEAQFEAEYGSETPTPETSDALPMSRTPGVRASSRAPLRRPEPTPRWRVQSSQTPHSSLGTARRLRA